MIIIAEGKVFIILVVLEAVEEQQIQKNKRKVSKTKSLVPLETYFDCDYFSFRIK